MLSRIEHWFIRLLRGTVIITAAIALIIALILLLVSAYAFFSPEPRINTEDMVGRIQNATDPKILLSELFPKNSSVIVDVSKISYRNYKFSTNSNDDLFNELNKFVDVAIGGGFNDKKRFDNWLNSLSSMKFTLSDSIDTESAANEDNANNLWRSMLYYYAARLNSIAPALQKANMDKLYPTAFERLTSPTGGAESPYFLYWFFDKFQAELQNVANEFSKAKAHRVVLISIIPYTLAGAAGAYLYFISIMFLFLVVSIEASGRSIAESQKSLSLSERNGSSS